MDRLGRDHVRRPADRAHRVRAAQPAARPRRRRARRSPARCVNVDDRSTLAVVHGGGGSDAITVTGGAGPVTQLVVYGDTSQDGAWYAGGTAGIDAGAKPFGGGRFLFPVGVPFSNPGNDFINAEALFDDAAPGALPSLGITAYGGAGDDTILGTQAADMLLGGSGDDEIFGERGPDRIWGDSGLIVGVIDLTRTVVTANTSVNVSADGLVAGSDILFGEGAGNTRAAPGDFDDIIFGDHGVITFAGAGIIDVVDIRTAEPDNGAPGRDLRRRRRRRPARRGRRATSSPPATATTSCSATTAWSRDPDEIFTTDPGAGDADIIERRRRRRRDPRRRRPATTSSAGDGDNIVLGDFGVVRPAEIFTTDPGICRWRRRDQRRRRRRRGAGRRRR